MEIKELGFLENLSGNDNKTSAMDSVIGGHRYGHSYSYDFDSYFSHPVFDQLKDFDFGKEIEVTEVAVGRFAVTSALIGVPDRPQFPFK